MEYTYEFLRKCHGLRFQATICNKPQEGIIKVTSEGVMLCYGEEDPGYLVTFGRRDSLSFSEQTFSILPSDFEIVPRDPETYQDWQVGDKATEGSGNPRTVIFRSGEIIINKYFNGEASCPFTCLEFFENGYRLVLTDIEKQIIEEKKQAEWKPQDGDVCYTESKDGYCTPFIYRHKGQNRTAFYVAFDKWGNVFTYHGDAIEKENIKMLRPATDEEKQRLFDALAKEGKRWNAEKKVVEDIEPEDNKPEDVQKMITDTLEGYTPKGHLENFPIEVIAKMLERQYEQTGEINVSVFEEIPTIFAPKGFNWDKSPEGENFWISVICGRNFPKFFKRYPKDASTGDSHKFKKGEPVLMRCGIYDIWKPAVFKRYGDTNECRYISQEGYGCLECIPLNPDTEYLTGTAICYAEERIKEE